MGQKSHEEDPVDVVAVVADVADKIGQEDRLMVEVEADVELAMEEEEHDDDVKGALASLNKMAAVAAAAAMREHGTNPYNFRPAN